MPFCSSCGAASENPIQFCPSCGAKSSQVSASNATTMPQIMPAAPVQKKSSPLMKILVVLAVLFVFGLAALAYAGYWAKNKVQQVAAANGIVLPTGAPAQKDGSIFGGSSSAKASGPLPDACSMFTQADADAVLGEPTKLTEHQENDKHSSHCHYSAAAEANGANGFGVQIDADESAAEALQGQTIKKGLYSNFSIYTFQELSGYGDASFLSVNKAPEGEAFKTGPLAAAVARQQIQMTAKGSREIEIIVSYFGPERSTDGLKALTKKLADQL